MLTLLLLLAFAVFLAGYALGVSDERLTARERDVIKRIDRCIGSIKQLLK